MKEDFGLGVEANKVAWHMCGDGKTVSAFGNRLQTRMKGEREEY